MDKLHQFTALELDQEKILPEYDILLDLVYRISSISMIPMTDLIELGGPASF